MKSRPRISMIAAATLLAASSGAYAYPTFTVDPSDYVAKAAFVADKIIGNYEEVITLTPLSAAGGNFDFSLKWEATAFQTNNGGTNISGITSGLQSAYLMYGLFTGSGTFALTGGLVSSFNLAPGGSLAMYIDRASTQTTFTAPTAGNLGYTRDAGTFADDVLIATGAGVSGAANFAVTGGFNTGAFGQVTTFSLTDRVGPDGKSFFVAPNPFYSLSLSSGQVNFGAIVGSIPLTTTINGSLDVIFQEVPEPASLPLVGVALMGLSLIVRRNKRKQ